MASRPNRAEVAAVGRELGRLAKVVADEVQGTLRRFETSARLLAERHRGRLDAEADDHLAGLLDGAARLQQMAKGFQDYAGLLKEPPTFGVVSLDQVLDRELSRLGPALSESGATVRRDGLPRVQGDARLLGRLFHELLANALVHAGEQPPDIRVGVSGSRVVVADRGPGLPAGETERAFDPFVCLHERRDEPRTGLGLFLARRIAELHGGRLEAKSEPGEGTAFEVELPPAPHVAKKKVAPAPKTQPDATVLAAEDDEAVRHALNVILSRAGLRVVTAANGAEAVERFDAEHIDLVLMDVQMPELDGREATRAIRQQEADTGRRVPVLALTAHTGAVERQRCLDAGMDDFIPKPFSAADLVRRIRRALDKVTPAEPRPKAPPATAGADVFDRPLAMKLCAGDLSLLRQVVGLFMRGCPTSLARIREAVEAGNALALASGAHGLKGTAHSVGGRAASDAALRLEKMGKSGDLEDAADALADLEREIERLVEVLEAL